MKLPAAEWTARRDLMALVTTIDPEGDSCRYVGGAVRDTLLGHDAADVDIATKHLPTEIIARLDEAGIRSVPTGIAHGTITAILDGGNVEITTLRYDVETDGRRATVSFATEWRDDAARRDFTINALYANPRTLEIEDWFGGLDDLASHKVRFIGDPEIRIQEDHLRILRYFRFHARFGSLPPDAASEAACQRLAPMLKGLSRERVGWELQNLLGLPNPGPTIVRMHDLGVLQVVLPETSEREVLRLAALIEREDGAGVPSDPIRRLAALLPPDPHRAEAIAARLRLSNSQRKRLVVAARREDPANLRALAYRIGRESAIDAALLQDLSVEALDDWDVPKMPVSGGDVVAAGIKEGPAVSQVLRAAEAAWMAEGFPDRERTQALLKEAIDGHLGESSR